MAPRVCFMVGLIRLPAESKRAQRAAGAQAHLRAAYRSIRTALLSDGRSLGICHLLPRLGFRNRIREAGHLDCQTHRRWFAYRTLLGQEDTTCARLRQVESFEVGNGLRRKAFFEGRCVLPVKLRSSRHPVFSRLNGSIFEVLHPPAARPTVVACFKWLGRLSG